MKRLVLPVVLLLAASGCSKHKKPSAKASASASARSAGFRLGQAQRLVCRAVSVKGAVSVSGGKALKSHQLIDGSRWLDLGKDAVVHVRHMLSAREFELLGPGRMLVCPSGEERILLANGKVITTNGPGARPGAEAMIATPFGTVIYGDARLVATLSDKQLEVDVKAGSAWVRPAPGAKRDGPEQVEAKQKATLSGASDTQDLVSRCRKAAEETARRARAVILRPAAKDAGSLGERAAAHVLARKAARAACATAEAAVGRTSDPAERKRLWTQLEASEKLWRAVPHR